MAQNSPGSDIYQVIFKNNPDPIIFCSVRTFTIEEVTPSACSLYGYAREEILRESISRIVAPESLESLKKMLLAIPEGVQASFDATLVSRQGRLFPTEINARLFEFNGQKAAVLACRDVGFRKGTEKQREDLLQQEIKLREKFQADKDMRTNYTRALVHELKTPLTSLMASSDYLVSHIRKEPLLSFAKNINFGAKAVNHRIDELHDLIRLELGTLNLEFYPVNLRQLLREITEFVKPTAERSELAFSLELPARLPRVWGDRERLQQVIMNLLNNAFKYTPKKGSVIMKASVQPGELVVEVRDTGCGMSPDTQKALFQPYERRDPGQQRKDGLGLGLVITRAIVERYKGRIWVESELGRGSRFFVALPTVKKGEKNESADN
ncbi:PAS domain-containing sensor histidine kinase [Dehalogenimonas etheniformans]|uniref:histidine kinase n=1 Tax=Dehalogenimonas etheniformans TaxID=1536648 RepID=A0A2P5P777_9CHLR|nr:PAS domain-containing sensor histidine kinase [Dehalogenimonas etheniformans]PPD58151.1 PAS domain-containing sensor histidine kinase [Dehalogenimonas etheniformans]QNT75558.1 PAS domain S-box protein [Dehalogenimonas etheniformans]